MKMNLYVRLHLVQVTYLWNITLLRNLICKKPVAFNIIIISSFIYYIFLNSRSLSLLLPGVEGSIFNDNWRIRQSSVELLGDLLFKVVPAKEIPDGWMGLDIGPDSIKSFGETLETTKTVIWNGPMGVFEFDKFAAGTEVRYYFGWSKKLFGIFTLLCVCDVF
ncbi:putative phosphoglycerate kinase [Helianthus anomalus]